MPSSPSSPSCCTAPAGRRAPRPICGALGCSSRVGEVAGRDRRTARCSSVSSKSARPPLRAPELRGAARFSRNAAMPSRWSSVAKAARSACCSSAAAARAAATAVARRISRLAAATASGPRRRSARRGRGVVEQLGGRQHLEGEPDAQALAASHRVAGQDQLHGPRRADAAREPLGAAEARDDAEVHLGLPELRAFSLA